MWDQKKGIDQWKSCKKISHPEIFFKRAALKSFTKSVRYKNTQNGTLF